MSFATILTAPLLAFVLAMCSLPAFASDPPVRHSQETGPLRVAVVGMVHGHVEGLLWAGANREDVEIVGIYEPNAALFDRLSAKYGLDAGLRFDDLEAMLDQTRPEAASVMTSIAEHLKVAEALGPRGVHALFEKPLAFTRGDAERIAAIGRTHGTLMLTNYETSWYASIRETKRLLDSGEFGTIRRMVFRHGHKGPIEIGVYPEFAEWLTDPEANGGGALVDFGCYGAVLATWLMDGAEPISIEAAAGTLKPGVYPRVDDDATIVVRYPTATAVIQASWAWTHDNKEMDVHAEDGSLHAGKWDRLEVRKPDGAAVPRKPTTKPEQMRDEWTYLREVVRGRIEVDALSSPELNVIAAGILGSARERVAR